MKPFYKDIKLPKHFDKVVYGLIAFSCSYLLFPVGFVDVIFPYDSSQPWWIPLDTSWVMTINYSRIHDLTWGKDFVFTYGPLGQLSTRYGWGENRLLFLLFDFFVFLNWLLIFYLSIRNSASKYLTISLIVIVTLFVPAWTGGKISIYLFLFLVFWIRQSLEQKSALNYIMQVSILVVCFFIKFNSALVCLPFYYLGIFYLIYKRGLSVLEILIYAIAPLAAIIIASAYLNVSLYDYVTTGFDIVAGYNEVMYEEYPLPGTYYYLFIAILIILSIVAMNFFVRKDQDMVKRLLIAFIAAAPFFILYKQGFVRCNPGYNADFFACLLVYFVTTSDLHFKVKNKVLNVFLVFSALSAVHYLYGKSDKPLEISSKISKENYVNGFKGFTPNSDVFFKNGSIKLPESVVQKISNATVDAYPWNIRMLLENNLNYLPRPAIQSYSTYTQDLENINFEFYNSDKAPKYVIYEYGSLDQRYPLFDESKVNIVLKTNYEVEEIFDYNNKKMLLLKKKEGARKISFEKINEYAMFLNSPLVPKQSVYYEIEMYNDLKGKAYSLVKHAPKIVLEIQIENGAKLEFRTSKKLLKSGIFGNDIIEQTEDFADIINNGQSNKKVKYYNFRPSDNSMFNEKIRITEYKIIQ